MYSVQHHRITYNTLGSTRFVIITLSSEVKSNGKILKSFAQVLPSWPGFSEEKGSLGLCYVQYEDSSTVIKRSIGLCFKERISYRPINCPNDVQQLQAAAGRDASNLPVRLIDIQGTLHISPQGGICFIQPTDWSFHTLSHTWSLAVREFSKSIGESVNSAQDYNKAFQEAKLHELPGKAGACYRSLLAFLTLLKEEGVKAIWFDALCINQTDTAEKDREISRMGAYYGCSLGCYVSAHGIGKGFKLWAPGNCDLPRWFERVWTLQEFLLPRKVTFIVEGLAKRTIDYVNHFVRQGGVPGLCKCALPLRDIFFQATLKKMDAYINSGGQEKLDEILCSSQGKLQIPCDRCRCVEFIRRSDEQPGVYFVDREAYCFLCQLDLGPCEESLSELKKQDTNFWNLFALTVNHYSPIAIGKVAEMLRPRQCSNEEDRVLGVLGLLRKGKAGDLQLRSGKTLNEQLLNLHLYCDEQIFFRLCLMEPMAFQAKGMSWAPCLKEANAYNPVTLGEWDRGGACFHPWTRILNVSPRGLKLAAQVACGHRESMRCIPRGKHSGLYRSCRAAKSEMFCPPFWDLRPAAAAEELICYFCIRHESSSNCTHWIRECELEVGESYTFPLKAHAREGCAAAQRRQHCVTHTHMVIQDPWIGCTNSQRSAQFVMSFSAFSIHALKRFPVWLVLIGKTHECMVGVVCIGSDDQLHKIGIFAYPMAHMSYDRLFFLDPPQECLIGGFEHAYNVATRVSNKS